MCILLLYFKQGKRFCFSTNTLVNLRRMSSASSLTFKGNTRFTLSTANDLFQSEYNRISLTPSFQRLTKAIRI